MSTGSRAWFFLWVPFVLKATAAKQHVTILLFVFARISLPLLAVATIDQSP
jgi:hypothetical protein